MSSDSSYPTVKIHGNTIINHDGCAIWFGVDAKNVEVSHCLVLQDYCSFWNNPLLWVALKIIKRMYYSLPVCDSSPTTNIGEEDDS